MAKEALLKSLRIYSSDQAQYSQIVAQIELQLAVINFKLGKSLYDAYKYEECTQFFAESLPVESPYRNQCEECYAEACYMLGLDRSRTNQFDEAIDYLQKSIQIRNINSPNYKREIGARVLFLVEMVIQKGKSHVESNPELLFPY